MTISVVHGSIELEADDSGQAATISALTMDETLVLLSYATGDNQPGHGSVIPQMTSTTNINFTRVTASGSPALTIHYTLITGPELFVQRGTHTHSGTTNPVNVTLGTEVDPDHAACVIYARNTGTGYNADDFSGGNLTSGTNLAIRNNDAKSDILVHWQVVECASWDVQRAVIELAIAEASDTATLNAFDPDKSWLLVNAVANSSDNDEIGEKLVRVAKTNGTTLTATREATGAAMSVYVELIEMTDASTVEEITVAFGTTDTDVDDAITEVGDLDRTAAIAAGNWRYCGGSTAYAGDDIPGVAMASLVLDSLTNLNSIRGATGSTAATLLVNVIEFLDASAGEVVTPTTLALVITPLAPTVSTPRVITPAALALILTPLTPAVSTPVLITPDTLALTTSVMTPAFGLGYVPVTLELALEAFAPTVTATELQLVTPSTLALVLTPNAPTISTPVLVTPTTASLSVSGLAPVLDTGVVPTTLALALTTFAPTVAVSDHRLATPVTAELTLTLQAPTVSTPVVATPGTLALIVTLYPPIAGYDITLTPSTLALVLAFYAPSSQATIDFVRRRAITSLGDGRAINTLRDGRAIDSKGDGRKVRRFG